MKTLITLLLLGVLSSSAIAEPNPKQLEQVVVFETTGQSFKVLIKEAVGKVTISIYDAQKRLVEKNLFRADRPLSIPFNLSKLPQGEYHVKVEDKDDSISFSVDSRAKAEQLMAYVEIMGRKTISLRVVGIENPGTKVSFYDAHTLRKLQEDKVDQVGSFSRKYTLAHLNLDDVYVTVEGADGKSKTFYF